MNSIKYYQKENEFTEHDASLSWFLRMLISNRFVSGNTAKKKRKRKSISYLRKRGEQEIVTFFFSSARDIVVVYYPSTLNVCIVTSDLSRFFFLVFFIRSVIEGTIVLLNIIFHPLTIEI
jgi:hypothetical protein